MTGFHSKSYPTTPAKELNGARPENQFKLFSPELKPNFNTYSEVMFNKANQIQLLTESLAWWSDRYECTALNTSLLYQHGNEHKRREQRGTASYTSGCCTVNRISCIVPQYWGICLAAGLEIPPLGFPDTGKAWQGNPGEHCCCRQELIMKPWHCTQSKLPTRETTERKPCSSDKYNSSFSKFLTEHPQCKLLTKLHSSTADTH